MRLIGREALVNHRNANAGDELLDPASVLTRTLGGYAFSATKMARQSNDELDRIMFKSNVSKSAKIG